MKKTFLIIHLLIFSQWTLAQNQLDEELQNKIQEQIKDFKGEIGIYVQHLPSGKSASFQADSIFPTASIVKIPILLGVFDKIETGNLSFHQPLIYRDSIKYGGSGLMQFYKDSVKTELRTLLALMMSYSDNTTSLWSQALAGGGSTINPLMEKLGYEATRINSRTPGREKNWEKYGWGQTSPREISKMLVQIYRGEVFSPEASELMYRLLSNSYYHDYALSQIPPYVNVASKQGMVNESRSEVFLVNAPEGDYVCAILTKNNEDQSWSYTNEAWELTRKLSRLIWNHFNPNHPYYASEKMKKYQEGLPY
ncbi:serine hydrolase [Algoriphagus sp. CAU 1675]|uniref:serine hydrolase n=1 Tax=Algoriphagus sp. CAU 1675 TaxID=3032597 RepID=UPI0023DA8404|nr:serine hydrolase [Algoriphagus sp. CAU 1675]MDF2158558.1 class A beta-lactamase-related serine hydrolase [Algoriphagus sp. CAU 1675]